jgi:cytochrome c oxidase subunit 2
VGASRSDYQHVFDVYLPIAAGVVVVVIGFLVVFALRFRARPGREVSRRDEAPRLEAAYVAVLALIAAFLVTLTLHTEGREDAIAAQPDLKVHAIAAKWRWRFDYPGGVSQIGTNDAPSTLVVPQNRVVAFQLDAVDVIHAMWVPDLKFKKDAIPGRHNYFDLRFPDAGFYAGMGECSEFCGLYHAQMRFNVRVLPPAAFRSWLARRQREAA